MIYKKKSMTQVIIEVCLLILLTYYSVSFSKVFGLSLYTHDGSLSEFLGNLFDIGISFLLYGGLLIYFISGFFYKDTVFDTDKPFGYISMAVSLSSVAALFYIINYDLEGYPIPPNYPSNANELFLIPLISNFKFYLFDVIIILTLAFIIKKYSLFNSIKYVVFFKILMIFAFYIAYLGIVKIKNDALTYNAGDLLPATLYCNDQYLINNYGVLTFKDCPYKDNTPLEKLTHSAADGSYMALIMVSENKDVSLKKLASIGKSYYENNVGADKTTWIEEYVPSVYNKTYLHMNKNAYIKNRVLDEKVIYAIETDNQTYLDNIINGGIQNAHSTLELALFTKRNQ